MADFKELDLPDDFGLVDGNITAEHARAPMPSYALDNEYQTIEGLLQVPVAGEEGDECDIIRVCSSFGRKIVRWSSTRIGRPPLLPHPTTFEPNLVLAKKVICPSAPMTMEDQRTKLYIVRGVYVYYQKTPQDLDDPSQTGAPAGYQMGAPPYDITQGQDNILPPEFFVKAINSVDPQAINTTGVPLEEAIKKPTWNIKGTS